jgi:hypothetical protein
MVHDIFHHVACPDLLYDGSTDDLSKKVQIIHRMMSEALTLIMADVLFVHNAKQG